MEKSIICFDKAKTTSFFCSSVQAFPVCPSFWRLLHDWCQWMVIDWWEQLSKVYLGVSIEAWAPPQKTANVSFPKGCAHQQENTKPNKNMLWFAVSQLTFHWLLPIQSQISSERIQSKQKSQGLLFTKKKWKLHHEIILYSSLLLILCLIFAVTMLGANQKPRANKSVKSKLKICLPSKHQFKRKITFHPKPLASSLPLKSFVSHLASPWLSFVRSQLEAKAFLTEIMKFSRPIFLHLLMRFLFQLDLFSNKN